MRTALDKVDKENGTIHLDQRGGRKCEKTISRDKAIRESILKHIDRFPRMESHYCRASTTREYLHPDLSVSKMHYMYIQSLQEGQPKPSFVTYQRVFRSKKLSFHHPKKDQCSLCMMYKTADAETKAKLEQTYHKHEQEKITVRKLKDSCKLRADSDSSFLCASFDLQQVIYLNKTNESAVFYKRRLAVFNFTFYNISTKDCFCYCWDECASKRGSSEISTCVYKALQSYDNRGIKVVSLYSDGCSGQNKNSIIATMLLFAILNSVNIEEVIQLTAQYHTLFHMLGIFSYLRSYIQYLNLLEDRSLTA